MTSFELSRDTVPQHVVMKALQIDVQHGTIIKVSKNHYRG